METIKEVCEVTGVTRKTLRGYNDMDLLKPTAYSKDGNRKWLYDDAAVRKVLVIQFLFDAGYGRKQIKEMLDMPFSNLVQVFKHVIEASKKRRNHTELMIAVFEEFKLLSGIPYAAEAPACAGPDISFNDFLVENIAKIFEKTEQILNTLDDSH